MLAQFRNYIYLCVALREKQLRNIFDNHFLGFKLFKKNFFKKNKKKVQKSLVVSKLFVPLQPLTEKAKQQSKIKLV